VALPIFALWPTAPPRLLPAAHVQNILAAGGWWSIDHGAIERINDPFAAMPSLHLVWSTWVALSLFTAIGVGRRRLLVFAYPLAVSFVVLATGAHWLLDLVAGAALMAVAWLLTGLLPSARSLPTRR
jgi:membrane-associated phospholipid phosphatase